MKDKKVKVKKKFKVVVFDVIFEYFKKYFKFNVEYIKLNNGLFQFIVIGDVLREWRVDLN